MQWSSPRLTVLMRLIWPPARVTALAAMLALANGLSRLRVRIV